MRMAVAVALALTAACVDKHPGGQGKQIDPAYVAANLLTAPPEALTNPVHAELGQAAIYLGNVVEGGALVPGQKVTIKHYWQVVTPPGSEWRVFSHLRGEGPNGDFQNVDATDMRTGHPVGDWKAGEIIQDVQEFALKPDWKSPTALLIVGMYPKGKHAISDRMPIKGGQTLDGALIAVRFKVDTSKGPPPAGTVIVKRAGGAITIDGKGDDPGWRAAVASGEFPVAEGSPDPSGKTVGRMTWDDQFLYLFLSADDTDVASQYANQDDPLWKEDTFEVFIDADGNRRGYVELQVNPKNAHFDTWWPINRGNPDDKSYTANLQSAVTVRGTLDDRDDEDQGWDAEIAIPWAAVKGKDDAMKVTLPPTPGTTWRMNVVRVDKGKAEAIAAASWSRITYSDFHALDRMLTVVFADATGGTTPPAAPIATDGGVPGDGGAPTDGGAPGDGGARDAAAPVARDAGAPVARDAGGPAMTPRRPAQLPARAMAPATPSTPPMP
jgi:hypothetical protein